MAGASSDEVLDGVDGVDAAAGADGGAVEGGSGAGEIELALQGPILQEAVDEAGVKNVSGAGSVHCLDAKSSGVMELLPVPGQNAFFAESGSSEAGAKSFPERGQGLAQVRFFRQPPRNVPAGDEVVDALQELLDPGIKFVQIGDHWNAGGAGPARSRRRRGSIVSVQM